jgi:hypothetical protein
LRYWASVYLRPPSVYIRSPVYTCGAGLLSLMLKLFLLKLKLVVRLR